MSGHRYAWRDDRFYAVDESTAQWHAEAKALAAAGVAVPTEQAAP